MTDLVGPIAEVLGYLLVPLLWWSGLLSLDYLLAFLAVTFTFSLFLSVTTLILEEVELRRLSRARDLITLTFVSILENFGYRQLNNIWRLIGLWDFLRGRRSWGRMTRKAFAAA